jgi:hypothetical protein
MYGHLGAAGTIDTNCTVTDLYLGGQAVDASSVYGTVTREWGWHVGALSKGAARFQFGATEHTITGAVPAGEGVWGVEAGSPNRFYFENESGHVWRMGYATVHAAGTDGGNGGLNSSTSSTNYLKMGASGGACSVESNCTAVTPGNVHVYAMACSVTVAPGTTSNRVFTLRQNASDTTLVCTIGSADKSCTARDESGVAVGEGVHWSVKSTVTTANAANASGGCVLYYNLDAF